jgi:single-strand DNA-binding protein
MYYNKVILVGRLVRAPESQMLPSGTQVTNLVIAYNRNYKDQNGQWKEESHFFEVKVFGRVAERVAAQLGKGDLILIEGRLHQDKWLDKQTGQPRSKVRIVALDVRPVTRSGAGMHSQTAMETPEIPEMEISEELNKEAIENIEEPNLEDIEKLLLGEEEEENKEPPKGKEKKENNFDDLDDLLL